ncbi:MAG: magnesium/cobalt transporter CorA [Candidatus Thermoplasmatota archaeon]|nr:magnesium/cobalt transporter CorA [Candidatus Thermoplasmatota archaeon]
MEKYISKSRKKGGLPPGALIHIGDKKLEKTRIKILDYSENEFNEKTFEHIEECFPFKDKETVTWINIDGIHDVDVIEKLGKHFDVHPLVLEDILDTTQRPKMEDFESYIYFVLKMLYKHEKNSEIIVEQISLILGNNFVISFQESKGDVFDPIRERIRNNKGRIRKMGADYLAYALIDAIVDNYFVVLEKIGDKIGGIEDKLIEDPSPKNLKTIHYLKREMIFLRKSVWPLREVISALQRSESELVHESTGIFLRDVYDNTIQVMDTIETYRDMISGMLDIYMSSVSNKMNEIMKVLTIFAAIFIPLTFIAGVYGMNFDIMPELHWEYGYPMAWIIILAVSLSMIFYFRKKNWL